MENKVVIFTEAGKDYGYGHVTRCVALYDELERCGHTAKFIINGEDCQTLRNILQTRGYELGNWYNETIAEDRDSRAIVDSYTASLETYESIANAFQRVLYIDDTNRLNYPEGIVLNPAIAGDALPYQKRDGQTYLLGSRYVILRKEFREAINVKRKIREKIEKILIIMGGSDILNLAEEIEHELKTSQFRDAEIIVARDFTAAQLCEHMLTSDIAITAAGQTVHELIACKLPFMCIKVIDNQEYNIRGLIKLKIIDQYVEAKACRGGKILELVEKFRPIECRENISSNMSACNFFQGVGNIIDLLTS